MPNILRDLKNINKAGLAALNARTHARVNELAAKSMPEATAKAYASAMRNFDRFCGKSPISGTVISTQCAHKITVDRVSAYLSWLHDERAVGKSSLSTAVAALKAVALECNANSDLLTTAGNKRVNQIIRGILAERADSGKLNASIGKAPLVADQLKAAVMACDASASGLRDRALLLIGFAGAFRRSELVAIQEDHIRHTNDGLVIALPRSKANQGGFREESKLILKGSTPATCPVAALERWLSFANIKTGYVFRRLYRSGKIGAPLSAQSVALIVKQRSKAVGLDDAAISAHSLRSGLVSSALDNGASSKQVMQITGHQTPGMIAVYDKRRQSAENHAAKGLL